MKRILYFFPLNPADNNTGSCRRALGLLAYMQERGFVVDFMSQEDWGKWTTETTDKFRQMNYTDKLFILQRKPPKNNPLTYFFGYKLWHMLYDMKIGKIETSIPNHTTLHLRRQFDKIISAGQYDAIIISYAYWAHLIYDNDLVRNTPCIIDTHDFLTAQHVLDNGLQPGVAFGDEMRRLNFFNRVWAISPEEQYLYAQMMGPKVDYIPAWVNAPIGGSSQKDIDIIYVATDNPHNLRSATWFFKEVQPRLSATLNITVIGTIVPHLSAYAKHFNGVHYAEDINDWYQRSSIAICPMLTGTGLKIKVVEALANGLPVVCNERGLDGMPMRIANGCLSTNDAQTFANHINNLLGHSEYYAEQSLLARACYDACFTQEISYQHLDESFRSIGLLP